MMLYIIGPWTFQMIVLGLVFEAMGVNYEDILQQEKGRQEATKKILNRGARYASS